jgi:poly-gamma-glutamate synthesis protein (capsule biosynthesis protein)
MGRLPASTVVCLANNHSMDMGRRALAEETLPALFPFLHAGVGLDAVEAARPALTDKVAVYNFSAGCAGTPESWAAGARLPGVNYLPPIVSATNVNVAFVRIKQALAWHPAEGRHAVISIHWGPNWGRPNDGQTFRQQLAHRLVDELGMALIHGHSSHHVRGLEIYKGRLIVYGAGDLINDYERLGNHGYNSSGAVFSADLNMDGSLDLIEVFPFRTEGLRVKRLNPKEAGALFESVNKWSKADAGKGTALLL